MTLKRTHVWHVVGLPFALLGVLGMSLPLVTGGWLLELKDTWLDSMFLSMTWWGIQILDVAGMDIPHEDVATLVGAYVGFGCIPILLLVWGIGLLGGWIWDSPLQQRPLLKTWEGWPLILVYYPLVTFGTLTVMWWLLT